MTKATSFFLSLFLFVGVNAQNFTWEVSPSLRVSLPTSPDSTKTKGITIYNVTSDDVYYQVLRDSKKLNIGSEMDFKIGLQGMEAGYKPKLAGFTVLKNDTTIGGTKGMFVYALGRDSLRSGTQVFMFSTIVNGHCYMLQCATNTTSPNMAAINQFFRSARFQGDNYPTVDAYNISYKIGQYLGYLLLAGVAFLLIRALYRMPKRN